MGDLIVLAAIVLSIAAFVTANGLRKKFEGRIATLERELTDLRARHGGGEHVSDGPQDAPEPQETRNEAFASADAQAAVQEPLEPQTPPDSEPAWGAWADSMRPDTEADGETGQAASAARTPKTERRQPVNWEQMLGVRLPIWLGAATLAIAGFFFISWLVESGAFTPLMRVIAGLIAGLGFLCGAEIVRRRDIANGANIASALAAAAIAIFYGTIYVASIVFELLPEQAGFIGMVIVTALAISIALLYGQVVAVVGLLGGYAAPLFFSSDEPSAALLFTYLTAIVAGIFWLMRLRGWWGMRHAALAGPLIWTALWTVLAESQSNMLPVVLFLLVMTVIAIFATQPHWDKADAPVWRPFKSNSPAAATLVATIAVAAVGFLLLSFRPDNAIFHMGFVLLSGLVVGATALRPVALGYLPVPLMLASVVLLILLPHTDRVWHISETVLLFMMLGGIALEHLRRGRDPVFWARALSALAVLYFLGLLVAERYWQVILANRWIWTMAALAMAAGFAALTVFAHRTIADTGVRPRIFAAFTAAVTGFVSVAVAVSLDPVLFPVAAALQVFGLSLVWSRFRVDGLRWLAAGYAVLYVLLITASLLGDVLRWMVDQPWTDLLEFLLVRSPEDSAFILLILPGIAFIAAATFFRRETGNALTPWLDSAAVIMLALGAPMVASATFDAPLFSADSGVFYMAEAIVLLALAWLGIRLERRRLFATTFGVAALVGLIALFANIGRVYEFWPYMQFYGPILFNTSLLVFGGPALMGLGFAALLGGRADTVIQRRSMGILGVLALFTLVIVQVRYAFNPDNLQGGTSDLEFYTYSAAILLFGLALLVAGVMFKSVSARALSMGFVLAAAAKVFLLDTEGLRGLWRVASFLGLGLSLLAIAWFYARFVFHMRGAGAAKQEPEGRAETAG